MDKSKWEYEKLGEVATFIGGGTPSKTNTDYYSGNIPWATVRDMTSFMLNKTEYCITEEAVANSATNIIPQGTIVISTHVGLGKICELQQDTAINQDLKAVSFKTALIDKRFFSYWYKSISDYIISNGKGATVKGVTLNFIKGLNLPIPSLSDQNYIVSELDQLSAIISLKQQQMKEYDALAQSLFYEMFGDENNQYNGFQTFKLSELFEVGTGSTPSRKLENIYYGGTLNWVKTTEIHGNYISETEEKITQKALEDTNCKMYPSNTILIAMYGQGKTRGQVARLSAPAATNQACSAILPKPEIFNTDFLFEFFLLSYERIRNMARGGTQSNLNLSLVKSIEIPLPPLSLQRSFAEKVKAIEHQKSLLKQSIAETQTLLDSRMQEYFS